jgi:hypothetical protein
VCVIVKRLQHMPHFREVTVKTAFFPCRFIKYGQCCFACKDAGANYGASCSHRLDFYRVGQTDISVYGCASDAFDTTLRDFMTTHKFLSFTGCSRVVWQVTSLRRSRVLPWAPC